jgi:integral membrane sensor domain MASE1
MGSRQILRVILALSIAWMVASGFYFHAQSFWPLWLVIVAVALVMARHLLVRVGVGRRDDLSAGDHRHR